MKVLHIISGGDFGGAKTHLTSLAKELRKKVDMKIVCFIPGEHYLQMKEEGLPVVLFEQSTRYDVSIMSKLINMINKDGYEVVHCHGSRANWYAFMIKPFIKAPTITTVHSDYKKDFEGSNLYRSLVYTTLNSIALRFFDYYIGVSKDFKEMLIKRKFRKDRIFAVYHGLDFNKEIVLKSKEEFAKKHNLIDVVEKKWIGIAARLEPVKGLDVFIKGAAEVLKKRQDAHFVIAGRGQQKEELEKLCGNLGVKDGVSFIGHIDDVNDFFGAMYINTITSYSESLTYVLPEGGRLKKPSISSRVGGIPDLIIDGKTGMLFEKGNHKEFANKIEKLLDDEQFATELGNNLYLHTKENFSMDKMVNEHIKIYEKIKKKSRRV